jgi:D-xylose 1-dehydrogenase (NADP+, D-xylono-1,5-lactone-forming)
MRMRFGILGAARIARNSFVPGVRGSSQAQLHAVASRDLERARAFATEFEIPRAYGSYTELLADQDVDAVYIAVPNNLHVEWTIAAARAGKHVLCEKPLAASASEAERARTACAAAGVLLMEGFMWRHHIQHRRVWELIDGGAIGEPTFIRASFSFRVSRPRAGATPNVRLQSALQGGSLMDVGCYGVNAARWLFGSEPTEVIGQQIVDDEYGVDLSFGAVLRFDGNRQAVVDSSLTRAASNTYTIEGTEGSVRVERAFRPDTNPGRVTRQHPNQEPELEEIPAEDQFTREVDHFIESVAVGRLLSPAEDGVNQAKVIEALKQSAETGRSVSL